MKRSEGKFTGPGNLAIYYQYWQPEVAPRAVILVVHGAAEHSGRYQRFAEYFTARDYAVVGLDHPGHGQSEGTRVYVDSFEDFLASLRIFHQQVEADFPGLPIILLGHSLGGLISCHYLLRQQHDFAGCVLSGPAIMTDLKPGIIQTLLVRLLSAVAPRAGVLQLDAAGVSRDPQEVERYCNDPLVYNGKLTARTVSVLFDAMNDIQQQASKIRLPLLMLHGGADVMATPEGSRFLNNTVSSIDKTLKIYPGLFHEIFNEPEYEAVYEDVQSWCKQRAGLAAGH